MPHAYPPVVGGAEVTCQRVTEWLCASGHDVSVVTANVGTVQGYYEYGIEALPAGWQRINGIDVLRLPYGNAPQTGSDVS